MKPRGTKRSIMIGGTTLLLCAGLAIAAAKAASTSTAPAARTFMQEAASGGLMEVELARLLPNAPRRATSPLRDAHTALVAYDTLLDQYRGEVRRASLAAIRRHLVQGEEQRCHASMDLGQSAA